ncbi:MAG: metallophosphoesterase family protein [Victivallales bacterium]|nr:metallophosphoesterase family protein [Victivallales bacterium]
MRLRKMLMTMALGVLSAGTWAGNMATPLKFSPQGKFKIVQFTDLHLSDKESEKNGDNSDQARIQRAAKEKIALLRDIVAILDVEKPNLVIFTGDLVLTPKDFSQHWKDIIKPLSDRNIPWAAVMGNHDKECTRKTNREIITFLEKLPGSLTRRGPENIGGGGNYVLIIKSSNSDQTAFALFCMDSGGYADKKLCGGYAWFPDSSIAWFRQQVELLTKKNNGKAIPSMAFFHIPFPEFDTAAKTGKVIGTKKENVCCPKVNSGMFVAMLETKSVIGAFVGHDHSNDYLTSLYGICLGYGRKTGDFHYRDLPSGGARVIELNENSRSFSTWIRTAELKQEHFAKVPDAFQTKK